MKIIDVLEESKDPRQPLVLTIGNFDGMHRGHTALLKKMKELAGEEGQTVVITFRNHPSEILRPEQPIKRLITLDHRLQLLHDFPIDHTLLITFTQYLAQHSASFFIENIRQSIPFSYLVLGHDATLGRDKQGDRGTMHELGDLWGFTTFYIDEHRYEGKPISSSKIRETLQQGDLTEVETLLGRPYSIYAPVDQQSNTIVLNTTGLCTPPLGVYNIELRSGSKPIEGTASVKPDVLEIKLQGVHQSFGNLPVEISFKQLIHSPP